VSTLSYRHPGLDIITMEEFLKREGITGRLRDRHGVATFPPGNRTDWDGDSRTIFKWLRKVSHLVLWSPDECFAVFPASRSQKDIDELVAINKTIQENPPGWEQYVGKPTPVDAPAMERMKEAWSDRSDLCIYDKEMQDAPLVHFPVGKVEHAGVNARMLVYFYAFLFFQDWNQDLWMKVSGDTDQNQFPDAPAPWIPS